MSTVAPEMVPDDCVASVESSAAAVSTSALVREQKWTKAPSARLVEIYQLKSS